MSDPGRAVRLDPEIVRGMQSLALEQRTLLGPRAQWHVGDLAWNLRPRQESRGGAAEGLLRTH